MLRLWNGDGTSSSRALASNVSRIASSTTPRHLIEGCEGIGILGKPAITSWTFLTDWMSFEAGPPSDSRYFSKYSIRVSHPLFGSMRPRYRMNGSETPAPERSTCLTRAGAGSTPHPITAEGASGRDDRA